MSNPTSQSFPPTLSRPSFLDEVLEAVMDHPLCKTHQLDRLAVVLPSHRAMSKPAVSPDSATVYVASTDHRLHAAY